jgi:predicted RNase H-like nuclease (RuvC/YqgF family)
MKSSSKRPFLIGGIDVGLHTSFALLDLGGNIVYLDTLVHPQNSDVLDHITELGNVMILSTDRAKPPSQAKKIAASISAKLVLPAKNMTKKKKRILIDDFIEERKEPPKARLNNHEKSALASAIFAYKKFKPGFKKLEDRMKRESGTEKFEKLRNELFLKMIRDK